MTGKFKKWWMEEKKMDLREALMGYIPYNEQEEKDREQILKFLERGDLVYTRESKDVPVIL